MSYLKNVKKWENKGGKLGFKSEYIVCTTKSENIWWGFELFFCRSFPPTSPTLAPWNIKKFIFFVCFAKHMAQFANLRWSRICDFFVLQCFVLVKNRWLPGRIMYTFCPVILNFWLKYAFYNETSYIFEISAKFWNHWCASQRRQRK